MHKILAIAALAATLTIPAAAQTQPAAELLQKGIYAQETAGDLDGAIKIFRQVVDSHPQQRDIGAQAQYRLGMTLLAKGDSNSASQEIQRLGWDYPDFKDLISSAGKSSPLVFQGANKTFFFSAFNQSRVEEIDRQIEDQKAQLTALRTKYTDGHPEVVRANANLTNLQEMRRRGQLEAAGVGTPAVDPLEVMLKHTTLDRAALIIQGQQPADHEAMFDFTKSDTLTGTVVQINFSTPYSYLTVNHSGALTSVFLASANTLNTAGWNRNTVRLGDPITITGAPARDGSATVQATEVSTNGRTLFSRPNVPLPQVAIGAYEK